MGRNNADFHGGWFHVSNKSSRAGIEAKGLIANDSHEGEGQDVPKAVYVSLDKPDVDYGTDIYKIEPHPGFDPKPDPMDAWPAHYSENSISPNHVKRVGHVHNGRVHWHPEEECRG